LYITFVINRYEISSNFNDIKYFESSIVAILTFSNHGDVEFNARRLLLEMSSYSAGRQAKSSALHHQLSSNPSHLVYWRHLRSPFLFLHSFLSGLFAFQLVSHGSVGLRYKFHHLPFTNHLEPHPATIGFLIFLEKFRAGIIPTSLIPSSTTSPPSFPVASVRYFSSCNSLL